MKTGMKWSVIGSGINKLLSIAVFILLAQKLQPSDFGVIAIVSIMLGFSSLFTQAGYKEAIIYFKIKDELELSLIFWLLLALHMLVFSIALLFKGFLSDFFGGGIEDVILYVSFLLPLYPIKVISSARLEAEL